MMPFTMVPESLSELPDVDERLVAPGTRYEIEDGRVIYVPPADEPHAELHANLSALLHAHRAPGYSVALDMLTRTSRIDDFAPDASVYPTARDPRTGGRHIEELAFEIASIESLGHVGRRAAKLVSRGVRRVFALDLERTLALEWSQAEGRWSPLERGARIEDPALAVPLPIEALLDPALADDAIVRALRAKRHPEFIAERMEGEAEAEERAEEEARGRVEGESEGRAEGLLIWLAGRGLEPTEAERRRILGERDLGRLERWLAAARACTDIAALLAVP